MEKNSAGRAGRGPGITLRHGMRDFFAWIGRLFRMPAFLFVTLWGHAAILAGAIAFHFFESGVNPQEHGLLNAYYWAISTTTTVGSSEMIPMTLGGKAVAILMMVLGSLFLWSYTALFASSFMGPEVRKVGREVREVEQELRVDQATLERLLHEIEALNRRLGKGQ